MATWIQDIKGYCKVSVFAIIALVVLLFAVPVSAEPSLDVAINNAATVEKPSSYGFDLPTITEFEVGFERSITNKDDFELNGSTAYVSTELDVHKYLITHARIDGSFNGSGLERDHFGTVGVYIRPFQTKRTEFLIGGSTVIPIGENATVNTDEYVLAVRFRLK